VLLHLFTNSFTQPPNRADMQQRCDYPDRDHLDRPWWRVFGKASGSVRSWYFFGQRRTRVDQTNSAANIEQSLAVVVGVSTDKGHRSGI